MEKDAAARLSSYMPMLFKTHQIIVLKDTSCPDRFKDPEEKGELRNKEDIYLRL